MARFNCSLPAAAARDNAHIGAEALATMHSEDTSETPGGPGWFDSSRELVHGLEVTESAPGDAALTDWVRLCFSR